MAFWKIKFGKKKINLFKDVCMLTESVNKSFIAGFMIVATACRVDERSLSGFSFECDSPPSEVRS